jgi:ribosomal protein S18 acetylase RimI-like enzyme
MLELRRFEEADATGVWDLHNLALNEVGAHAGNGAWDADLRSVRASYLDDGGEFLVGLLDGRLVAMGGLRPVTATIGEIKRMRVHPAHQRRGFGRLVLERLEASAVEGGYLKLRLETTVRQDAAQQLYRQAGYREVSRGHLAGFDVIFFEKRLR